MLSSLNPDAKSLLVGPLAFPYMQHRDWSIFARTAQLGGLCVRRSLAHGLHELRGSARSVGWTPSNEHGCVIRLESVDYPFVLTLAVLRV